MPTRQFTERAFDGIALMHLQLKGFGALFEPTLLQKLVVFAHNERAMFLAWGNAPISKGAALAVALTPLETVGDFGFGVLANAAAAPAFVASRAVSASVGDVDVEVFDSAGEPAPVVAGWLALAP
jgi:hypothetical protein